MIPLKDNIPSRGFPFFTLLLIGANVAVFIYELSLGDLLERLVFVYGIVPKTFLSMQYADIKGSINHFLPLITATFLHGGWFHLLSNMWFLWLFGDNIESHIGHMRFFFFYILCGVVGYLFHTVAQPQSMIPAIGASGAIAGVLGAYLYLYPGARIITLVPIFFFLTMVEVPAFLFLGFWFIIQFLNGLSCFAQVGCLEGGIAWWAHIGGFVCGLLYIMVFGRRVRRHR